MSNRKPGKRALFDLTNKRAHRKSRPSDGTNPFSGRLMDNTSPIPSPSFVQPSAIHNSRYIEKYLNTCGEGGASRSKRSRKPPKYRWSPSHMDNRDSEGVTSALPSSWVEIGHLMKEEVTSILILQMFWTPSLIQKISHDLPTPRFHPTLGIAVSECGPLARTADCSTGARRDLATVIP
ncbi:hypothetical protein EVAR_46618_1 [Eumeta japonica]|uniref:Uncharacterized protein n=1 Tax=Eumeta variegata TaxID=151549 RepID=A0A4C1Z5W2_EUMVA|nr:hypothetical protein EVAR_46618_1 [Eumeta japonica]